MKSIRVVCFSDTHTFHNSIPIPDGDIAVHSGDATFHGYKHEVKAFGTWYSGLPYQHKIFVAGNHDTSFQDTRSQAEEWLGEGIIYLQDDGIVLEANEMSITAYGAPWQPEFGNWAFNLPRGEALKEKWDMIWPDTDILITHGPPYGIRDKCNRGEKVGCRMLKQAIGRVRPKLHICGHIHEEYGVTEWAGIEVANASNCNSRYSPVNEPLVFDIFEDGRVEQV